jgi:hypothetical protein
MTGIAELHAQTLDVTGRIVAGIPADRWHNGGPIFLTADGRNKPDGSAGVPGQVPAACGGVV